MPDFRFHRRGRRPDYDLEGVNCSAARTARVEAIVFAGEMLRDQPELVWCGEAVLFDVVDEGGETIFTLVISSVDKPNPPDCQSL